MNRLTLCLVLGIAACGSKAKPADTSTPPTGAAATAVAWADLDATAREAYMKEKVMPQMKEIFVAFDAEEFGEMKCKTCHGPGAEDGSFEMPNPELDKLDFDNMDKLDEKHQKIAKWMGEVVTPKMAELLGMPVYDPATQKGFGCLGCHTMVQK
jgi:hypothetical protein